MEKKQLSPKQQEVYDYFIGKGAYNLMHTANHFKNSVSTIHYLLSILVYKGWLKNNKWQKPAYKPTTNKISEFARGYQLGYSRGKQDSKKFIGE